MVSSMAKVARQLLAVLLCLLVGRPGDAVKVELERNNWAVLVGTSRYWYNYRHVANTLTFYHHIKRLGIPDSQIILMLAEDMACNPRNAQPGTVYGDNRRLQNLYGEDVEVDYRGDEVSVENFIRLLTGRHPPDTPQNKRLQTDEMSNVLIFITGHSGDEFIKFQDWEEITSNDIADAFGQMHKMKRYRKIFWISDTCQAATLQNQFYSPDIIAIGSSGKKENSYSHHVDYDLGVAVIDRFTFHSLEYLNRLETSSKQTLKNFKDHFNPRLLYSNPEMRTDLFTQKPEETLITDFLASTGKMRFQGAVPKLARGALGNSSEILTQMLRLSGTSMSSCAAAGAREEDADNGVCAAGFASKGDAASAKTPGVQESGTASITRVESSLWTQLRSLWAASCRMANGGVGGKGAVPRVAASASQDVPVWDAASGSMGVAAFVAAALAAQKFV